LIDVPPAGPRRGVILVIEDHYEVRIGLAQLLELNGFLVTDVGDAERAFAQLQTHPDGFALVLLDLLLPGVSGTDLRARQLADPELADIPVVVVSASEPDPGTQARLRAAAWLEKPFRCSELLSVVRQFVAPEPGMSSLHL
jgi:CheY-like chemotaxis protein